MTRATLAAVFLGAVLAFAQAVAAYAATAPLTCPAPQVAPASAACDGPAPAVGQAFAGPVLQVDDDGALCVALGASPSQWVRVVVSDAGVEVSRGALMAVAFGRDVACVSAGAATGGVRAVCQVDGVSVAALAGAPEAKTQAASWR